MHALARCVLGLRRVNAPPRSREDKELPVAGILQVASEALTLALRAGGGNEEPIRDGDREQQRRDAFEQLPTCTHANLYWKFRHCECRRRFFATKRSAMLPVKPGAGKRRGGPGSSAGSR